MKDIFNTLKQDIEMLKRKDRHLRIFGAASHNYKLNPTLSESHLLTFEEKHKITLPDDYRLFLKEVGNGGVGPYYGMFPLENFYQSRFYDGSDENCIGNDFLQTPFPYSKNNPFVENEMDDDLTDEVYAQEFIKNLNGTITLAHQGCGYFDMLIVSGEDKGKVWIDARVSDYGMNCIFDSFTEWYFHWLNASIKECVQ